MEAHSQRLLRRIQGKEQQSNKACHHRCDGSLRGCFLPIDTEQNRHYENRHSGECEQVNLEDAARLEYAEADNYDTDENSYYLRQLHNALVCGILVDDLLIDITGNRAGGRYQDTVDGGHTCRYDTCDENGRQEWIQSSLQNQRYDLVCLLDILDRSDTVDTGPLNQCRGADAFWKAEFMLREIFDMQEGDPRSWETISHFPMKEAIERRRENYRYLLEHLPKKPGARPVFPELPEDVCPMFFPSLTENREALMKHLAERQIPPKVYWPVPPFVDVEAYPRAKCVYSHIMSVSCDERFTAEDMQKIVEAFEEFRK